MEKLTKSERRHWDSITSTQRGMEEILRGLTFIGSQVHNAREAGFREIRNRLNLPGDAQMSIDTEKGEINIIDFKRKEE